jgi:hypothetical protein
MKCIAFLTLVAMLAGCVSTPEKIVETPKTDQPRLPIPITSPAVVTDLQGMVSNLDNAMAIGALPADDRAAACGHDFLRQAGLENPSNAPEPKSFTPRRDGPLSDAAILYIQAQQAKQLAGTTRITVSADCKTMIGQFVIDGVMAARQAAGLIPGLRAAGAAILGR